MDKLADGLQKLNEDDLLQVVQMVQDHKAPDSYTKNDVERKSLSLFNAYVILPTNMVFFFSAVGEFHVDLYTLPDTLVKMLWDFTAERVAL